MNSTHELAEAFLALLSEAERAEFERDVLPNVPRYLVPKAWRSLVDGQAGRVVWQKGVAKGRVGDAVIDAVGAQLSTAIRNHPVDLGPYSPLFRRWSRENMYGSRVDAKQPVDTPPGTRSTGDDSILSDAQSIESQGTANSLGNGRDGLREQLLDQYPRVLRHAAIQMARAEQLGLTQTKVFTLMSREIASWGGAQSVSEIAPAAHQRIALRSRLESIHATIDRVEAADVIADYFGQGVALIHQELELVVALICEQLSDGTLPIPLRHMGLIYALDFLRIQKQDRIALRQGRALALCVVMLGYAWLTLRRALADSDD